MSGDSLPRNELSATDWDDKFWSGNKHPAFHETSPHQTLIKYYDKVFEKGEKARVFLPLCGKSQDLIYLADCGHDVVGLEFSEAAVDKFFRENNIEFVKTEGKQFTVYKASDRSITIFRGDLYNLKPETLGRFDAFWDRGSFTSINVSQRNEYADIMFQLMKPKSKYLLDVLRYDSSKFGGPPHSVSEESLKNTVGRNCDYQLLRKYTAVPRINAGIDEWDIYSYFLWPRESFLL